MRCRRAAPSAAPPSIDIDRHHCTPRQHPRRASPGGRRRGRALERGETDLLIAADFAVPRTTIARPLLRERYVMAQRKGHPGGLAPPGLDAYCALRHVIVSGDGGGFHGFMDDRPRELRRTRFVAASVRQYHLAPLVLEATDDVCALPERFLTRFAERLDLLPLPVEVEGFALAAAWHPRL
ncbi:LysR substrate-binding domain-containing protein [Burkholderia oklahomensis]|uniref:LysR substrate-binding domain-containing protein n=1 Tax=Burkholderia oklahomensis TaxID=342113 RepID=UPI00016A9737|nr:LysR substrate-binding domain-containing protein [Burkholderia oklahomensis]AJX31358.1 lysR substrate binding domain protein [Burkholderia oklahomensis C6786]AOI46636.1 LysR family transcriptional regulator [Burkholderia oklahomensis C6786]KUY62812.1 LysR family transcriptional regulator [Burkholderia oklahomensis C6786]MBI0360735.1 LysR family transcriptional regulator [Burkholderia oklahomensis]SUW60111.1 Symbiotic regulator homolog 1 [Burkholderia oklahomensis]